MLNVTAYLALTVAALCLIRRFGCWLASGVEPAGDEFQEAADRSW